MIHDIPHYTPEQPANPEKTKNTSEIQEALHELQNLLNQEMLEFRTAEQAEHKRLKQEPRNPSQKQVLCFIGLPGAGKTTQIMQVKKVTGAEVVHAGKTAKKQGVPHEEARSKGKLIEGVNDLVLNEVADFELPCVILDGFPRSTEQTNTLLTRAKQENWNLSFIYFSFTPGNEVQKSFERQYDRDSVEKPDQDHTMRILGKIKRSIQDDLSAAKELQNRDIPIHIINAEGDKEEITQELYEILGLDYESLEWETETLQIAAEAAKELGIEAWPGAGLLYRPFWNGRFGPAQESTDKDIHVASQKDAQALLKKLQEKAPHIRWSVDNRMQDTKEFYGIESPDLQTAMQTFPLTFREGGVRFQNGKLDVLMTEQAERDIRRGILRIDEELLERVPPEWRDKIIDRSLGRAIKMIDEYPGLRMEGRLKELYQEKYGSYKPSLITVDWVRIQDKVWEQEHGGRQAWLAENFTESDKEYCELIRQHYLKADKKPTAPSRPNFSPLPEPLETYRKIKQDTELGLIDPTSAEAQIPDTITPPEGYYSWMHFMATSQSDGPFKEWFLNQVRSRKPISGKDPDVLKAIQLTKENKPKHGEQKATHMGFPLHKHTQEAVLQTSTDWLDDTSFTQEEKTRFRTCIRMAMLYHDHGKLHNVHTPGSHEGIGAKIWESNAPSWMTPEDISLTKWMIQTHDIFGRLARGITEKKDTSLDDQNYDPTSEPSYQGALDPVSVREYLKQSGLSLNIATQLHYEVWRSDVKSVSALRWILPVSDYLKDMILHTPIEET